MAGFYILTGENIPEKEAFLKKLLEKEIPRGQKETAFTVFHGKDVSANEIVSTASSNSLFSSSTFTLVRSADQLTADVLEALSGLMARPNPNSTLVLEGKKVGARLSAAHPFHKAVKKHKANVVKKDFKQPPSYKIDEWIIETAGTRYKRTVTKDAAQLLHQYTGDDLLNLTSEMEKLDIVLPQAQKVTDDDVRRFIGNTRSKNPWELPHHVGRKEISTALTTLKTLYDFNINGVQVLYPLADHFLKLLQLKTFFLDKKDLYRQAVQLDKMGFRGKDRLNPIMAEAVNESGYASRTISPNQVYGLITVPKVLDQLQNYTMEQFKYIVRLLAGIDMDLKSGLFKDTLAGMERIVFYIIFSDRFRINTKF
jgi:DNA polymerase III delta subunit